MLTDKLEKLKIEALEELKKIKNTEALEMIKIKYLGRKGQLSLLLRDLKKLADSEKPKIGALANEIKTDLTKAFDQLEKDLGLVTAERKDFFDPTLPGKKHDFGHLHPISQTLFEVEDIFSSLGFRITDGPELESEYYNFVALNIPKTHPARDMQDTFFVEDWCLPNEKNKLKDDNRLVLRTQTSAMQVRAMEKYGAPLKMISYGRCFRYEASDASHDCMFDQVEGLVIDKNISVANLIATMKTLLKAIFRREVVIRLRPGYFPFVEPAFELDIQCLICHGQGCPVCKKNGWVELIPCGMVHPKVLAYGGLDPKIWSGFAFGLGFARLVMMRYGIDDIRLLSSGDLRFIKQF
jgi:phenylalanyl-tRNA synthetase alpha chain